MCNKAAGCGCYNFVQRQTISINVCGFYYYFIILTIMNIRQPYKICCICILLKHEFFFSIGPRWGKMLHSFCLYALPSEKYKTLNNTNKLNSDADKTLTRDSGMMLSCIGLISDIYRASSDNQQVPSHQYSSQLIISLLQISKVITEKIL